MKHVILITVDALKNVNVGSDLAAASSATPRMNEFFNGGARFDRVFAASFPTQFAMPGLMLGDLPLDDGGYHVGIINRGESLAQKFQRRGYKTIGVTTDLHTSRCYGYDRGFEKYIDVHDVAWHVNSIARNDISFLANKAKSFGIPKHVALQLVIKKMDAYLRYLPDFLSERADDIARGVSFGPQVDNWNFARLLEMARLEVESFDLDASTYAQNLLEGKSQWFSRLPRLRIGPHYPDADIVLDRTLEFISDGDRPLFLWVHLTDVHGTLTEDLAGLTPVDDDEIDLRKVAGLGRPFGRLPQRFPGQGERSDWRAIRFLDRCCSTFLRDVERRLGAESCVFAISADHGDHRSERYGYGACLGVSDHLNLFDELLHIPLLIRAPGWVGRRKELLSILDVGTLLSAASEGLEIETSAQGVARNSVISEHAFPGTCAIPYKPLKISVRSMEFRVEWFDAPNERFGPSRIFQIFDLISDPLEKHNLAEDIPPTDKVLDLVAVARERATEVRRRNLELPT